MTLHMHFEQDAKGNIKNNVSGSFRPNYYPELTL